MHPQKHNILQMADGIYPSILSYPKPAAIRFYHFSTRIGVVDYNQNCIVLERSYLYLILPYKVQCLT